MSGSGNSVIDADAVVLKEKPELFDEYVMRPLSFLIGCALVGASVSNTVRKWPVYFSRLGMAIAYLMALGLILVMVLAAFVAAIAPRSGRVILDSSGITFIDKTFFLRREIRTFLPWGRIRRIYVFDHGATKWMEGRRGFKQFGVFSVVEVIDEDGSPNEDRVWWEDYRGDWQMAVAIIRKNLPEWAIGDRDEFKKRYPDK